MGLIPSEAHSPRNLEPYLRLPSLVDLGGQVELQEAVPASLEVILDQQRRIWSQTQLHRAAEGSCLREVDQVAQSKVAVTGSCTVRATLPSGFSASLGFSMTLPPPASPCTLKVMPSLLAFTCLASSGSLRSWQIFRNSADADPSVTL